ncbi:hypothetical protein F511_13975 [Dorcoceras hygrometricum]|uniref:Uncharacterized protein n=1 Tax=Dorcoceras hygrometricum TaxID=472368 RepID=A0A2Z7D1C9_9LAMI|nr:hypothetical protein F511_13975 [Dorcoceras hygrometricum]
MAGALPDGPPPGPVGPNLTELGSNRWLTRENWSLQVDALAMLHRRDHLTVLAFVPAPATMAGALPDGPPPGPVGPNLTELGSNRWLTRENWSLQVDALAMLHRRDHLTVLAFVLPAPATTAGALQDGPPPGPDGSNMSNLTSNHGPTRENKTLQVDAPALQRDAPLTTSTT